MNNNVAKYEFLTPIGRLVQGDVWTLNDTDQDGKPLMTQDGKPKKQVYYALAIDKNNPDMAAFMAQMAMVAQQGYPQFFNNGQCILRDFAWKLADGDGTDANGKSNASKPGWAGHWVLKFTSSFLPRCFMKGRYEESQRLTDTNTIKNGYFVRVGGTMQANIGSKKPGLYLNSDLVELNFNGDVIVSGRSASDTFGNAPQNTYMPAGAIPLGQSVPVQNGGMPGQSPMGGMPGQMPQQGMMPGQQQPYTPQPMPQQQGAMPGQQMPSPGPGGYPQQGGMPMQQQQPPQQGYPQQGGMPPQQGYPQQSGMPPQGMMPGSAGMPGTQVQPNPGFTQGAMQAAGVPMGGMPGQMPQQGMMPGQGMPQQQRNLVMTTAAQGWTREQFNANGVTDDQMVAQGFAQWQ